MIVFYLDESGCLGELPTATSSIQPVFILGGILLPQGNIRDLTIGLLALKKKFYPKRLPASAKYLDWMNVEVKGAALRYDIREGNRDQQRHAFGFMDKVLDLLSQNNARMLARIYIKGIGVPFGGKAVYTSSVQSLATVFQRYLGEKGEPGLMVLDSRNKPGNANVSHSIFTQKFRSGGDRYSHLMEVPLFGHSDNHTGIQCADLLCSAFLFPMATYAYCLGAVSSVHVHPGYESIRNRYGNTLKSMTYRYQESSADRWQGGFTVSDGIGHQSSKLLLGL